MPEFPTRGVPGVGVKGRGPEGRIGLYPVLPSNSHPQYPHARDTIQDRRIGRPGEFGRDTWPPSGGAGGGGRLYSGDSGDPPAEALLCPFEALVGGDLVKASYLREGEIRMRGHNGPPTKRTPRDPLVLRCPSGTTMGRWVSFAAGITRPSDSPGHITPSLKRLPAAFYRVHSSVSSLSQSDPSWPSHAWLGGSGSERSAWEDR
jgi:hypothetical protein